MRDPRGLSGDTMLAERHSQSQYEQLVELQPFGGPVELTLILGEVDVSQGPVVRAQLLRVDDLGRHGVRHRRELLDRLPHKLADGAGRYPLAGGVHGGDPSGMHLIHLVAAQHLHLLVRELASSFVERAHPADGNLDPFAILADRPRLVEEREIQIAGAVVERHHHHRLVTAGKALGHLLHVSDHRHVLPDGEVSDGGYA